MAYRVRRHKGAGTEIEVSTAHRIAELRAVPGGQGGIKSVVSGKSTCSETLCALDAYSVLAQILVPPYPRSVPCTLYSHVSTNILLLSTKPNSHTYVALRELLSTLCGTEMA
eukprot:3192800-Rhodomonas_salina.2